MPYEDFDDEPWTLRDWIFFLGFLGAWVGWLVIFTYLFVRIIL